MTVAELIAELQKLDPTLPMVTYDHNQGELMDLEFCASKAVGVQYQNETHFTHVRSTMNVEAPNCVII